MTTLHLHIHLINGNKNYIIANESRIGEDTTKWKNRRQTQVLSAQMDYFKISSINIIKLCYHSTIVAYKSKQNFEKSHKCTLKCANWMCTYKNDQIHHKQTILHKVPTTVHVWCAHNKLSPIKIDRTKVSFQAKLLISTPSLSLPGAKRDLRLWWMTNHGRHPLGKIYWTTESIGSLRLPTVFSIFNSIWWWFNEESVKMS